MAKLYFNYGCMGSTKTLSLLTSAYQFEEKNISFLCLKPSIDVRSEMIESRVGIKRECLNISDKTDIFSLIKKFIETSDALMEDKLKWIFVDECQFLTEEQVEQLSMIVDYLDVNVSCYGLRTDFQTKLFPASKRLFEIADTITEIKSPCSCGRKTIVNARFDKEGKIIVNGSQVMIGGNELYRPICRKCWREKVKDCLI